MVRLVQRLSQDSFRRRGDVRQRVDLSPYRQLLDGLQVGDGALLALEEGEHQRVVKRRLSIAAHERALDLRWLTAPAGHLHFRLRSPKPAAAQEPAAPGAAPAPPTRRTRTRRSA